MQTLTNTMTGQKLFYSVLFIGVLLNYSSAKKFSAAISYQPEDLRAIRIDVIKSKMVVLNSSTPSATDDLALKLQEIQNSLEEIKETLRVSSYEKALRLRSTADECGALRAELIGNYSYSSATDNAGSGNSIRDMIQALSFDIAAIKTKLATSWDVAPSTMPEQNTTATVSTTEEQPTVVKERSTVVRNISFTDFDELVRRKPTIKIGKSFNGSSVSEIMSSVSRVGYGGRGAVVVFINHLDRPITNFNIHDPNNSTLHPAPSSIAPHTKEVFTFAEPVCCNVRTAFSYNIAPNNVRLASFMDPEHIDFFGIAFVPTLTSMENYFNNHTGIPDSVQLTAQGSPSYIVGYQSLHAKMSVNRMGYNKATVVIEVLEHYDETKPTKKTTDLAYTKIFE